MAEIYDAVKAAGTAENPMAVAWTQWKVLYVKEDDKWVLQKTESAESMKSSIFESEIKNNSQWIPVAAIDQKSVLTLKSGHVTIPISEEALKANLRSWKGGYIDVNHVGNGNIDGLKIEDAKFENGLLYHKVNSKAAEFIRNPASTGRSINIQPLKIIGNKVMEFNGLGLSVLFPPHKPACTADMGCSSSNIDGGQETPQDYPNSHSSIGGNTMDENPQSMLKRFENLLHSFKKDNLIEDSGTDPNLEKTMNEDIEKLTSAKIEAEHGRDEALKEVETLKSSLVEKEGVLTDKDKTISEQTERLKSYETAEAEAATKLKDEQWETLKSSIPAGKLHKEEDAKALKEEFLTDPAGFAVKMASFKKEDPQGESGAEFTGEDTSDEAADLEAMSKMNKKLGRV